MTGIERIGNVFDRVDDMDAAVRFYTGVLGFGLRDEGATISDVEAGPHERRAKLTDPAGNQVVLYEPA